MPKNMGGLDRVVRVIIALVVAFLILSGRLSALPAILLGILALVFLLTSAVGSCPLYMPLKISTKKGGRPQDTGTK
jgi:hypothetical protein